VPTGHGGLPSGLVTFVLTDIEGSTRLFRSHPQDYPRLLQRHRDLLRATWPRFAGVEVSTEGDGTLVAFPSAAQAVAACAQAQRALTTEPWTEPIRVRMGMHTGLAHPLDGDYVAIAVHQAARVAAVAHGGQVVVSAESAAQAGDVAGVELAPLGRFRLRDFDAPVALFQVVAEGLLRHFPAVRATPAQGHNLTVPRTSFVGRDNELDDLVGLLTPGRLVTVVGPGGVGKSRLAAEAGVRVAEDWPDGVWRVSVDDVTDAAGLVPAVADVLAVRIVTDDALREIGAALRGRRALLLLDGCEQHVAAVAALASALRSCPDLGLLVTSREPLHLGGELVRRLGPLPVSSDEPADVAPAVRLYLDRVAAAGTPLRRTPTTLATVRHLVARLDGLPLAVEIAAGLASAFTPEQTLEGLEVGLASLHTRDRSLPDRHRSLQSLLEWSERTLSPAEQAVLRRLAVFSGSFPLTAARAVATDVPVVPDEVPDHVWSLVDRSLVLADVAGGGSRYRLLDLVRQFGRDRLRQHDEVAATRDRAASWLLQQVGPGIEVGPGTLGRVGTELDNLRGLVAETSAQDADAAQVPVQLLALTLARYHDGAQTYRLGIEEVGRALDRLPAPTPARVALLTQAAMLHLQVDDVVTAQRLLDEAAGLREKVGTIERDDASVERVRGELAIRRRDPGEAVRIATESLAGDLPVLARARMCNLLTLAHHEAGDAEAARDAAQMCLAACEQLGDEVMLAGALGNLAEAELRLHQTAAAAGHQRRALRLAEALGQPVTMAYALNLAARLAVPAARVVRPHGDVLTHDSTAHISSFEPAVALVVRAQRVLDETGQQLYPEDAAATEALLAEARRTLGPEGYGEAERAGRALSLDAAVETANDILVQGERA
jgi:predicted ATPase/class 3 adenylate cyclase